MRCEYGFCLVCDKEIAPLADGKRKPSRQYTEVMIDWSNGSKMRTAVCVDCAQGPVWNADKLEMTRAIQEAWDKQGGRYDKEVTLV